MIAQEFIRISDKITMKLSFFLVLLSLSAMASIQDLLPAPLSEFTLQRTTLKEVEKKLGRADLVEGNKYYWEREGLKYALELSFDKKSTLQSIHFTFTSHRPSVEKLNLKDVSALKPYPTTGRSAGRFLLHKEKNTEVMIDPISKTIHTVKLK